MSNKINTLWFRVSITFVKLNGERIKAKGKIGDSILDIVVNNEIDLAGFGMKTFITNFFILINFMLLWLKCKGKLSILKI